MCSFSEQYRRIWKILIDGIDSETTKKKLSLGHAYNTKMELKKIYIYVATHMKVKVKTLIEIFV